MQVDDVGPAQESAPVVKVKAIRAEAAVEGAEVLRDAVLVQGTVSKQIFWVGEDGTVRHTPETVPFTQVIAVPGAEPGMRVQARTAVEHLSFHLAPDRSGVVQGVLLRTAVIVGRESVLQLVEGTGPVVLADERVGDGSTSLTVESRDPLESPATVIADVRAVLQALVGETQADAVRVSGLVHYQVFFVATDGRQHHQFIDVPFEGVIAVPGAEPGMNARVAGEIVDVRFSLIDGTELALAALLRLEARVTRPVELSVSPGPGPRLKLTRRVGEAPVVVTDSEDVRLSRPASSVLDVRTSLGVAGGQVHPGEVFVTGELLHRVTYEDAETGEAREQSFATPFTASVAVPGAVPEMQARLALRVTATAFRQVGPTDVTVTTTLAGQVTVVETVVESVETGAGPAVLAEEVVGEAAAQLLIKRPVPLPPPAPVTVERATLVEEVPPVQAQRLVEACVVLPVPAIKLKEVRAEALLTGVTPAGTRGLLVSAVLHVQVFFVGADHIVRAASADQPFQVFVPFDELPAGAPGVELHVEKVLARLTDDGLKVVVLAVVRVRMPTAPRRQVSVVVDVRDGVEVDRLLVRATVVQAEAPRSVQVSGALSAVPAVAPGTEVRVVALPGAFDGRVGDGQVLVTGSVSVTAEYAGVDGRPHRTVGAFPVELVVAEPEAVAPRSAVVEVTVAQVTHQVVPDGTAIDVQVLLAVLVKVVEREELLVVTDVRGPAVVRVDRETLLLDVVDDGILEPVPVSVVTRVAVR